MGRGNGAASGYSGGQAVPSSTEIQRLATLIRGARHMVAFTGAGASTESGLPDFRSSQGLWRRVPQHMASLAFMERHFDEFVAFYRQRIAALEGARPSRVHRILARWEAAGWLKAVITQNVDGLHQQAGSRRVLPLHGDLRTCRCQRCGRTQPSKAFLSHPYCGCGGRLRPNVVLFGEPLPAAVWEQARREALRCDLMLVVGSSLEVYPAASLPELVARRAAAGEAVLAIVNRDPTPLDEEAGLVLRGVAGDVLERVDQELARMESNRTGKRREDEALPSDPSG